MQRMLICAALATLAATAQAGAYTDMWWNPAESGWGANVVHQDDTAFVTLFVYGPDNAPRWYSAAVRTIALYPDGRPAMTGDLYRMRGPAEHGPFDPALVNGTRVGTLSLVPHVDETLLLEYEVDGRTVARQVSRLTFALPSLASSYHATFSLRQGPPQGTPVSVRRFAADIVADNSAAGLTLQVRDGLGTCVYAGMPRYAGKLLHVDGHYACTGAAPGEGEFTLRDVEVTEQGMTGMLRTSSATLVQHGRFAAARN